MSGAHTASVAANDECISERRSAVEHFGDVVIKEASMTLPFIRSASPVEAKEGSTPRTLLAIRLLLSGSLGLFLQVSRQGLVQGVMDVMLHAALEHDPD